jgi:membrane protease YdiL (CAAX protease family)
MDSIAASLRHALDSAGLILPIPWAATAGFTTVGLLAALFWSPVADSIASGLVAAPPKLEAFRGLQQSRLKLALGLVIAWVLGGFLEELVFRGVILRQAEALLEPRIGQPLAIALATAVAAFGASLLHAFQGLRAMVIIFQLSVIFGLVYVASGFNLWAVVFCHGLYDTIAFIRFANRQSRYSQLADE